MATPTLVVTLDADAGSRAVIEAALGSAGEVRYLGDLGANERAAALTEATVLLARNTAKELAPGELALIGSVRLVQFVTAGIDYIPLGEFPVGVMIAANGGAYAEPMAEHALALTLAALKRVLIEHGKLAAGTFDQFRPNRMLAGRLCGIVGFGGIGIATARLMRALGVEVHAINRSGTTAEPVAWVGRQEALPELLAVADILVLSLPLTPATRGLLDRKALAAMKPDAILVNLARGEIIEETALYDHLEATPGFTACIDAWWTEPVRHGRFDMRHPFTALANVIASPHNSASVAGWRDEALRRAVLNVRRVLAGETPRSVVPVADRMP